MRELGVGSRSALPGDILEDGAVPPMVRHPVGTSAGPSAASSRK
jgi:hypothetical protein